MGEALYILRIYKTVHGFFKPCKRFFIIYNLYILSAVFVGFRWSFSKNRIR
jgi:hypothetical protein